MYVTLHINAQKQIFKAKNTACRQKPDVFAKETNKKVMKEICEDTGECNELKSWGVRPEIMLIVLIDEE